MDISTTLSIVASGASIIAAIFSILSFRAINKTITNTKNPEIRQTAKGERNAQKVKIQ